MEKEVERENGIMERILIRDFRSLLKIKGI